MSSPVVPTWKLSNQPFLFTKRIDSSQIEGPVLPVCCKTIPSKQMKSPLSDLAIPKLQWVHYITNSTQLESMWKSPNHSIVWKFPHVKNFNISNSLLSKKKKKKNMIFPSPTHKLPSKKIIEITWRRSFPRSWGYPHIIHFNHIFH